MRLSQPAPGHRSCGCLDVRYFVIGEGEGDPSITGFAAFFPRLFSCGKLPIASKFSESHSSNEVWLYVSNSVDTCVGPEHIKNVLIVMQLVGPVSAVNFTRVLLVLGRFKLIGACDAIVGLAELRSQTWRRNGCESGVDFP